MIKKMKKSLKKEHKIMIKINWTDEKREIVLKIIEDYIIKHKTTCGESVMQCDNPYIEASETMADIVDIIKPERIDED